MSIPRQQFGINKFATSISSCPRNADAIKAIVIQRNNLAVVNGASTEMELVLSNFFETITNAYKFSIKIPGSTSSILPYNLYKINGELSSVKFLAMLPNFGTVSNVNEFLEWTTTDAIDTGTLYDMSPAGPTSTTSFDILQINCMEFGWGANLSYTGGSGPLWIGTNGGLLKWDGTDMKLFNTLNSSSQSDYIRSINVDSYDNLWIGASGGLSKFNENDGFKYKYNTENSLLVSNNK